MLAYPLLNARLYCSLFCYSRFYMYTEMCISLLLKVYICSYLSMKWWTYVLSCISMFQYWHKIYSVVKWISIVLTLKNMRTSIHVYLYIFCFCHKLFQQQCLFNYNVNKVVIKKGNKKRKREKEKKEEEMHIVTLWRV